MRAMDVMTTEVISLGPDTSVQALAALLSERGISGVPVVDADNWVVGVVSEGDLLHRVETETARRPEARTGRRQLWWLDRIASGRELARDYVKSHGRAVRDVMTRNVVAVSDTTELADIAMLLENEADQARASRARRQTRWHRQPGQPRTGSSDDQERAREHQRTRRPRYQRPASRRPKGEELGGSFLRRHHCSWRGRASLVSDKQPRKERLTFRVAAENIPGVQRVEEHIVAQPEQPAERGGPPR